MLKIINVVGARPNFVKIAPIVDAMRRRSFEFSQVLVHTGQHYDASMSAALFDDLNLPIPDVNLGVGPGSNVRQMAAMMERFEPVLLDERPDWVVVVGDVNSTLACALVCGKLGLRVAHVEAGLRSGDRTMPEELNRLLTDQIADLLLTPSRDADANLVAEGIGADRIRFVGNIMIDSLYAHLPRAAASPVLEQLGVDPRGFALLTLHRPSNVDDRSTLVRILSAIEKIGTWLPVVFPLHPRTRQAIERLGFTGLALNESRVILTEPLGYLDFIKLMGNARLVLTDSGGVQEETTVLGVPCLTLRKNTERPITIEMGTNVLIGTDPVRIVAAARGILRRGLEGVRTTLPPPLWDGRTADRILHALGSAAGSSLALTA